VPGVSSRRGQYPELVQVVPPHPFRDLLHEPRLCRDHARRDRLPLPSPSRARTSPFGKCAVRRFAASRPRPHETGPRPHVAPSKLTVDHVETTPRRRHARALGDLRNSPCPRLSTPRDADSARSHEPARKSPVDHVETPPRRAPTGNFFIVFKYPRRPRDHACPPVDVTLSARRGSSPRRRSPLRDDATRALGDLRNSRYPPSSTPPRRRRNVSRFELSLLYLSTRDARETPTARRPTLVHSANPLRPGPIDADCPDMTPPRHILPAIVALIGGN